MNGFPQDFLPAVNHQTITENFITVSVTTDQSLLEAPCNVDFRYNTVDNPYIDFSNSYLELWFGVRKSATNNTTVTQSSNIYSIVDKVNINMTYISPVGKDVAINFAEPSLNSSKARKFVALKELSKFELDKSMYTPCEKLYAKKDELHLIEAMRQNATTSKDAFTTYKIYIPLMLITGLATFDCAIKIKSMSFQFVLNHIKKIATNLDGISAFVIQKAFINFRHMYDINWGNDPKNLIKCIPNNCEICFFTEQIGTQTITNSTGNTASLSFTGDLVTSKNRSITFVPDYCLMYITDSEDSMIPVNTHCPTTINFQIGGKNMFTQTQFPTATRFIPDTYTLEIIPNSMLYNVWRSQSNPMCVLDGNEWYNQPIYLFPIASVVDVNTESGCEINYYIQTSPSGINKYQLTNGASKTQNIFINFIFVKFVRDGSMN
ncbi:hypothetical protein WA158_003043 [Blastocystis sp. Blastoise]